MSQASPASPEVGSGLYERVHAAADAVRARTPVAPQVGLILGRRATVRTAVPFGPALVLGTLLTVLLGQT